MQEPHHPLASDDGTLTPDNPIARATALVIEASRISNRPCDEAPKYESYLRKAGFVDIVVERYKWPLNEWPKDEHYKQLGAWAHYCFTGPMEGMLMALFTRNLGWSTEEVIVFCAQLRAAFRDRNTHAYFPV